MTAAETKTFEQALVELEQVVRRLEEGQIGLEEALQCYEQGIGLLRHCHGLLQKAEQRILLLTGVDEQGQPVLRAVREQ
jgi:exodeoxyribonuclease VII small subunit